MHLNETHVGAVSTPTTESWIVVWQNSEVLFEAWTITGTIQKTVMNPVWKRPKKNLRRCKETRIIFINFLNIIGLQTISRWRDSPTRSLTPVFFSFNDFSWSQWTPLKAISHFIELLWSYSYSKYLKIDSPLSLTAGIKNWAWGNLPYFQIF